MRRSIREIYVMGCRRCKWVARNVILHTHATYRYLEKTVFFSTKEKFKEGENNKSF